MTDTTATNLVVAWRAGDQSALDQLMTLVEKELRGIARAKMAKERPGHTLQPTAVVNEAFLRLVKTESVEVSTWAHLRAIMARSMRNVLIDHARRRRAEARGGGALHITVHDELDASGDGQGVDLGWLDGFLDRLGGLDQQQADVFTLRYLGGLSIAQTAEALGISVSTVKRDSSLVKMLFRRELLGG